MESFATSFGCVPSEARRLEDSAAREHEATWIRRILGKGIAGQYVIGYQLGDRWWTFCFERDVRHIAETGDDELWAVEAYDSLGRSWCDTFRFDPDNALWERAPERFAHHRNSLTGIPSRRRI
jgi:hypothetical protein